MRLAMKSTAIVAMILPLLVSITAAQNGGDVKVGYIYLDEDGNKSMSEPSFNYYDGPRLSLEDFQYRFKNGLRIKSNLENVNLENRNLFFGIGKTGLFGVDVNTNRYRRIYDFNGDIRTKRDLTSASVWVNPNKYFRLFADGSFNSFSGKVKDLFDPGPSPFTKELDYDRSGYGVGARLKYMGRMFQAEYKTFSYTDNLDGSQDQSRNRVRLIGYLPVPNHEWLVLSGLFQRFNTEYDSSEFGIQSTTAKGSVLAKIPYNLTLDYIAFINRAGSDSDFVKTDNVAHLFYVMYNLPRKLGLTAGYQYDINDDFDNQVKANSFYLSGQYEASENLELYADYGFRAEDVEDGFRLVGNEDRSRVKAYAELENNGYGKLKIGFENKLRKNDQIGSEADYTRYFADYFYGGISLFSLYAGYSYLNGDYDNTTMGFEFTSNQFYVNLDTREYQNFIGGFGMTYFRNKMDLDEESVNLTFKGTYAFPGDVRAELIYRVFNFDDYLFLDNYYTENIIEFNLIKSFSF